MCSAWMGGAYLRGGLDVTTVGYASTAEFGPFDRLSMFRRFRPGEEVESSRGACNFTVLLYVDCDG